MADLPQMDDDDVPFEAPARPSQPPRAAAPRAPRPKKSASSKTLFGLLAILYAVGAAAVGYYKGGLYLLAWLVAGPLLLMLYRKLRRAKS